MKPIKRNKPKPPAPQSRNAEAPVREKLVHETLVHIEKPIYGGSFLARDAGKAIFVPLALPGEDVRIRIVDDKGKRGYTTATVQKIVTAAPERTQPACPHFGPCGGCLYQHAEYAAQLQYKQAILRETFERGGVTPPEQIDIIAGEPWGYRNRIRLASDAAGNPGYRSHGSHAIVPIESCPIAAPVLIKAALAMAEILRKTQPRPRVNEIALFANADETELLVSISLAVPTKLNFDELASELQQAIPALTGAKLILEGRGSQPQRALAQWGAKSLHYKAAGFAYRVDHGAFFQVNRWLVDALVNRVLDGQSGALAWDLFAGVGLFARQLTTQFKRVVAVESAPFSTKALAANLAGTASEAVRATTLDFLRKQRSNEQPDLVVVDPPRAGLGADVTAELIRIAAPALAYVSCDPATLVRDLKALTASGYTIESVALADLFPHTFHLETVVRLRRV